MAQLVAYITDVALWTPLVLFVGWLLTLERRSHQRNKAQADAMRRVSDRRLP